MIKGRRYRMISNKLLEMMETSEEFRALVDNLGRGWSSAWIEGLAGGAKAYFTTALQIALQRRESKRPVLLYVTSDIEKAESLWEDISVFAPEDQPVVLYPASLSLSGEKTDTDLVSAHRRLEVLEKLANGEKPILVAPIEAILQMTLSPEESQPLVIKVGDSLDLHDTADRLVQMGYERNAMAENPGEFAVRGGILDIYPSTDGNPARIELFGDEVESIRSYDAKTQRSVEKLPEVRLMPALEFVSDPDKKPKKKTATLLNHLPEDSLIILDEPNQVKAHWAEMEQEANRLVSRDENEGISPSFIAAREQFMDLDRCMERIERFRLVILTLLARALPWKVPAQQIAFSCVPPDLYGGQISLLASDMRQALANSMRVVVTSEHAERISELLSEQGLPLGHLVDGAISVFQGNLELGFKLPSIRLSLITDTEIFGEHKGRAPRRAFKEGIPITSLMDLKAGDLVVHVDHGIGRYVGLAKLEMGGVEKEYLQINYAEPDKVYVPSDELDRVQKYIGSEDHQPKISHLGGADWVRTKMRVKTKVQEIARELLRLYAEREAAEGHSYSPDSPWQREMEDSFPYEETPDQLDAIQAVKSDLESTKPMDRLVCGDVGYGKTEVAMRAAFKVVNDGRQVAVLVPTTVLAQQHLNTFSERLAPFPVTVDMLSRFRSRAEQKKVIEGLEKGTIDIVIGTHRILSKDLKFRDLGLLIIDEEQRFGVTHKERLKQLRKDVDVLTLTATPIPRTLHMSLSGIRDLSLINDPPEGRMPVKTRFLEHDDEVITAAIRRELDRGGQVYFVHNRVDNLEHVAMHLQKLLPDAKIGIGHGQMSETQLERVMMDFYDRNFDILVCTTIIESGLDIPNVNTIMINNADHFGLAQLYQLRGRVGRSRRQGYCYLLCRKNKVLTEIAEKRIQALREFTDLGSGYKIALRDLEIRGAGNLLGGEQHGFLDSVGFDLYCQMISDAIKELRGETTEKVTLPEIRLPVSAYLPEDYISSEAVRITFYKKFGFAKNDEDLKSLQAELEDRFGKIPFPVRNMLEILRYRVRAKEIGIEGIEFENGKAVVHIARKLTDAELRRILRTFFRRLRLLPDRFLVDIDTRNIFGALDEIFTTLTSSKKVKEKA